jgi:uncharacterized RDD family membrane protein YckC
MSETTPVPPPPAPPTRGPSGPRASFGRRLVAALVDGILLGIVSGIALAALSPAAAQGVNLLIGLAYFGYFEGSGSGQTVGKRALGIRVIDFNTGGPIGFGRGLLRYLGKLVSGFVLLLGYLWMLWDKEKQTWHDKIATTVVVPVEYYPVTSWPG